MILNKLKQTRGSIIFEPVIVLFVGIILLVVSVEVARIYITINMLERKTDAAVLSVAAANVANVYDGVRESTGIARSVSSGTWSEAVSTEEVRASLINTLILTDSNGLLDRITTHNELAYRLSNFQTVYVNSDGDNLNFKTTFTVTIPLNFLGLNINQKLEVNTKYDARF